MTKSNSKLIREAADSLTKLIESKVSARIQKTEYFDYIINLCYTNLFEIMNTMPELNGNFRQAKVYYSAIAIQFFTDFYISLRCNEALANLPKNQCKILTNLESVKDYGGLLLLFSIPGNVEMAREATASYQDKTAYEKVLMALSLTEEDVSSLTYMNPFFQEEYQKLTTNINTDFIIRQIDKWQHSIPDNLERSYDETVKFLDDLQFINAETLANIMESLVQTITVLSVDDSGEELFTYNNIRFTASILKDLLKDYYREVKKQEQEKEKKLI